MERPPNYEEFEQAMAQCPRLVVSMPGEALMCVVGALQLALRHPGMPEGAAKQSRLFIQHVKAQLPPVLRTVVEMGDNPVFDR